MTPDELKRLLSPTEHLCPRCGKKFLNLAEFERCRQKHAEQDAYEQIKKEMMREPDPEPDEALVSLMETMAGTQDDSKNEVSG